MSRGDAVDGDLPLVTCTPWCHDGDDHPGRGHVDDQPCSSEEYRGNLTLKAVLCGDPSEPESQRLDHVITPVTKDALHAVPHVHLGRNDDVGVQLKPNEARRLGEALSDVAALGEK